MWRIQIEYTDQNFTETYECEARTLANALCLSAPRSFDLYPDDQEERQFGDTLIIPLHRIKTIREWKF